MLSYISIQLVHTCISRYSSTSKLEHPSPRIPSEAWEVPIGMEQMGKSSTDGDVCLPCLIFSSVYIYIYICILLYTIYIHIYDPIIYI